jgi:hypothetical protein
VLAVIVARDVADLGAPDFTLDDLLEEWGEPDFSLADDAWLAEHGEIAAYAALRGKEQLVFALSGTGTSDRRTSFTSGPSRR